MVSKQSQDFDVTGRGCLALGLQIVLGLAMVASVGFCVLLFVSQFVSEEWYDRLNNLTTYVAPLFEVLRETLDPQSLGLDAAPLAAALGCFLIWFIFAALLGGVPDTAKGPKGKSAGGMAASTAAPAYEAGRGARIASPPTPSGASRLASTIHGGANNHMELLKTIASKKKQIESATGEERDALNAEIKEAQEKLNAMKRNLAFMACDVVGSTKMKTSQNPMIVEHAFLAFREWADFIMKRNGIWKASWTPDGCMAAFQSLDQAVTAAQEMLQDIPRFNKEGHEMDVPFQVRLGVSYGSVLFPDQSKVDEITDQVIDLAGHLQKYAEPDTLLMAKGDLAKLKENKSFNSTHKQVDGHDTFIWRA